MIKFYTCKFSEHNEFDPTDPFHNADFELCKNYFNTDKLIKIVDADDKKSKGTLEELWNEEDLGLKRRGKELQRREDLDVCLDACWEIDVNGVKGLLFQNASPFYIVITKEDSKKLNNLKKWSI